MINFYDLQWYWQLAVMIVLVQGLFLSIPTIIIKVHPGSRLYEWLGTRNATNFPCLIIIKSDLQYPKAVLIHEWGEQEQNRFLPRGLINTLNKEANRRMEVLSKETETQAVIVLYNDINEGEYRLNEARSLTWYKSFKGYTTARIISLMQQVTPEARDKFYEINKIKRVRNYE